MATIIQASLDQSLKVDGWRGRRHAEYYNKRPAGEKNRRIGNEGKRQPFVSGASRAARSSIGHSRARMRVERDAMGKRAGTYND
jgi:hypothetical protein